MNAVETRGLTKSYKDFTLDALTFALPEGCILGLIGENGAGKTTTIRLLLGMTKPDGGTAEVLGQDIAGDETALREDIGVVLDEPGLPLCINAREAGRIMSGIFKKWDNACYEGIIEKLRIPAEKPIQELSRGNRMKLGIAIAMSHDPKLLILDEPTSGLDPVVRDEVLELFSEFTRDPKHSVLISSHIVSDLEKLCDYIAFVHNGKLMLFEEKDKLMEEYVFVRCSAQELGRIDPAAVIGRKTTAYGVSAIVRRESVPEGMERGAVTLEELFIFMVKEGA